MLNRKKRENTPILIGAAQHTQPKDSDEPLDPVRLMAVSGQGAIQDCGAARIAERIDTLYMVGIITWGYLDACQDLSRLVGINPDQRRYFGTGGNTPQMLVNKAAQAIEAGKSRMVLIAGGEAGSAVRKSRGGRPHLHWPESQKPAAEEADPREPFTVMEMRYDIWAPAHAYAFLENALRAAHGWSLQEHQTRIGRICERLSAVAADNSHAWTRRKMTAAEITTPSPDNRMVVFPYTLRMIANLHVDMSAALIMTSVKEAEALGIDPCRWIYPMGGAGLNNIWNVTRRPTLFDSPALRECARMALDQAGCTLEDICMFDFYSCFPWAVEMAGMELGISLEDPRPLTVTGGLPYFGGPGNNYSLHAIVTLVEKIRADRSLKALITAMGWYNTKLAVGIYGADPPVKSWLELNFDKVQSALDAGEMPPMNEKPDGRFTIETYIICHDRSGAPEHGTVIGRLPDGSHTMALVDADSAQLAELEKHELIGQCGRVRYDTGRGKNLFRF